LAAFLGDSGGEVLDAFEAFFGGHRASSIARTLLTALEA
jgi:hypothetical protein